MDRPQRDLPRAPPQMLPTRTTAPKKSRISSHASPLKALRLSGRLSLGSARGRGGRNPWHRGGQVGGSTHRRHKIRPSPPSSAATPRCHTELTTCPSRVLSRPVVLTPTKAMEAWERRNRIYLGAPYPAGTSRPNPRPHPRPLRQESASPGTDLKANRPNIGFLTKTRARGNEIHPDASHMRQFRACVFVYAPISGQISERPSLQKSGRTPARPDRQTRQSGAPKGCQH